MRILVLDHSGFMLDWVMRAQSAGHKVRWYIQQTEKTKCIGQGLAEIVSDYREWLRWSDLIVLADNTRYLKEIEGWKRDRGALVVGATPVAAALELDRTTGQKLFKKRGVKIPPYREFTDYDAAIAYVKREDRAFVSKPCGDEPDKSLSYVAKSPADLVYMLERWKKAQRHKGAFILQEKVSGVEMAVGGWFGPAGFSQGWCENWEEKKLMNGGLGVATGEQGTTLHITAKSKLADMVLKPFEDDLAATGYVGYVDVNCIIGEDGTPWPLEWTMRFGYPLWNIQQPLVKGDCAEWLMDLASGKDAKNWISETVALGVVMSIPDYPYSHLTRKEVVGVPIYGMRPKDLPNIHPCEMMLGEAPQQIGDKVQMAPMLVTAGDYVLVASGTGPDVRSARQSAYSVLNRLKDTPNSPMWRTDIGMRLKSELPKLQELGFASDLSY